MRLGSCPHCGAREGFDGGNECAMCGERLRSDEEALEWEQWSYLEADRFLSALEREPEEASGPTTAEKRKDNIFFGLWLAGMTVFLAWVCWMLGAAWFAEVFETLKEIIMTCSVLFTIGWVIWWFSEGRKR
jgi:hypothetical protein